MLIRQRDVAAGDQSDSAAEGVAVNDGERRARKARKRVEHVRDPACILKIFVLGEIRHAPHPVQIGTGGEALAAAHDLHHAHVVVQRKRRE